MAVYFPLGMNLKPGMNLPYENPESGMLDGYVRITQVLYSKGRVCFCGILIQGGVEIRELEGYLESIKFYNPEISGEDFIYEVKFL